MARRSRKARVACLSTAFLDEALSILGARREAQSAFLSRLPTARLDDVIRAVNARRSKRAADALRRAEGRQSWSEVEWMARQERIDEEEERRRSLLGAYMRASADHENALKNEPRYRAMAAAGLVWGPEHSHRFRTLVHGPFAPMPRTTQENTH